MNQKETITVNQTLDNPKGTELRLFEGMWLSENNIQMYKVDELRRNNIR